MGRELKTAWLALLRTPGFTLVALSTLAFSIGANTAIFSVVNGVLLRPLPYPDSDRLYVIREVIPQFENQYPSLPANQLHYVTWKASKAFEDMAIINPWQGDVAGVGQPEALNLASVSASFLTTLGVKPVLGRSFTAADEEKGHDTEIVISYALWQRKFGGASDVLGKSLTVDGKPYTIAGVLPASFRFPATDDLHMSGGTYTSGGFSPDVYLPMVKEPDLAQDVFGDFNYGVIARLRAGEALSKAVAALDVIQADFVRQAGASAGVREMRVVADSLQDETVGPVRTGLILILCAVGAVLLIACVNLANLMLVRAISRRREAGIRSALGASRPRLLATPLAEVMLLVGAGAIIGIVLAIIGTRLLVASAPLNLPRINEVSVDWRVLGFALVISCGSGLLFGLAPSLQFSRTDPQEALRSATARSSESKQTSRLREGLVMVEVLLSAMLLIIAGLLIGSFARVMRTNSDLSRDNVIAAQIKLPSQQYQEKRITAFYHALLDSVSNLPGVQSASLTSALPLAGDVWFDLVSLPGDTRPMFRRPVSQMRFIAPGYFRSIGVPLLRGRDFEAADESKKVVIVSLDEAIKLWHGRDPLGQQLVHNDENAPWQVIGIAADIRSRPEHLPGFMTYIPYWERPRTTAWLVVRSATKPDSLTAELRNVISRLDSTVPIAKVETMREVAAESVARRRFDMELASIFGACALLLALLGIYGVVAYSVSRRITEIGIRAALGAAPGDLRWWVVRQGLMPVTIGLVVGLVLAFAVARGLRTALYGVGPADPLTFAAVIAVLLAAGLAATYIPALGASRLPPMSAVRYE